MSDELVYLLSPNNSDAGSDERFMSLSKTRQGRLLRKKILPMNESFIHPADSTQKIFVDKTMAQKLVDNFNADYSTVQVPIVNDNNQHVEDPLRNAGEVIGVDYDDTGVYATIDARKYADDFGKTLLGASAFMHLDYTDTKTGNKVGPTLLHLAITNRPFINGLGDFTDLIAASADVTDDETPTLFLPLEQEPLPVVDPPKEPEVKPPVSLSNDTKDIKMTFEEWLEAGKAEHNIDVTALQADAAKAAELSGQLDEVNSQLQLSANTDDKIDVNDLAQGLIELSASNEALVTQVTELQTANQTYVQKNAENEVDGLVRTGRVLPKQRDAMVKLSMNDRDTFDALVPETALVSLSEAGVTVHEQPVSEQTKADVERYKAMASKMTRPKN